MKVCLLEFKIGLWVSSLSNIIKRYDYYILSVSVTE